MKLNFRASEIEFRQRFWFIGGIFGLGFFSYSFDHQNAGIALAQIIWHRTFNPNSAATYPLYVIFAVASALAVLAAALRTWGAAYLRSEIVHDHALHSEGLVADGPYRWMRNPLYVGGVLLGAGIGFLASPVGWFIITFGLLIFYYRLIFREEAALETSQCESFRAYCAAVPRFLPTVRPRVKSSGARPQWGQAFSGEAFIWGFAASLIAFTFTMQVKYFWIVLGISFASYALYWISRRGRAKAKTTPAR